MNQVTDIVKIVVPIILFVMPFLYKKTDFYRSGKANEELIKRISFSIANSSNLYGVLNADKFKKIYIALSKRYCINIKWLDPPTTVVMNAVSYLIDKADFCKDRHVYEQIQQLEMIMSTDPFENFTYHKIPRFYKRIIVEYIEDCKVPVLFLFLILHFGYIFTNFDDLSTMAILTYSLPLFLFTYICIFIADIIIYIFRKTISIINTSDKNNDKNQKI